MTLQGYRPLQARLTSIGQTADVMRQLGLLTVAGAKHRVARKTGTTGRTIRLASANETRAVVTVGGAGPYLEFDTRPHLIRPRNRKVLRFPAQGTPTTLGGRARTGAVRKLGRGAFAFAAFVRHPGTRKQPFLLPAARDAVAKLSLTSLVGRWNKAG